MSLVLPQKGPRTYRYGSKDSRKLRILGFLYSHSEGANQNTIHSLPGFNSQRWDLVKEILQNLIDAGSIMIESHDEIKKGAVLYKITDRGRETVEKLREIQRTGLGSGFDLFGGLDEN